MTANDDLPKTGNLTRQSSTFLAHCDAVWGECRNHPVYFDSCDSTLAERRRVKLQRPLAQGATRSTRSAHQPY